MFGGWCCALLCWLTVGCQSLRSDPASAEPLTRLQPKLGTFVSVTVYAPDTPKTQAAINAAFAEFDTVDQLLSIHRGASALARADAGGPMYAALGGVGYFAADVLGLSILRVRRMQAGGEEAKQAAAEGPSLSSVLEALPPWFPIRKIGAEELAQKQHLFLQQMKIPEWVLMREKI